MARCWYGGILLIAGIFVLLWNLPLQGEVGKGDPIETRHRDIFQQRGGYKGPADCYSCHSIAPAREALTCKACHTSQNGRLDYLRLGYPPEEAKNLKEER